MFQDLVPERPDVVVKPMFGNLGALVNGNMFMGLSGSDIGIKRAEVDRCAIDGAEPFGPEDGRGPATSQTSRWRLGVLRPARALAAGQGRAAVAVAVLMAAGRHAGVVKRPVVRRYGPAARWYDVLSFEWPVYRSGRLAAMSQLRLRPGDRVLDIGCGTGLNFSLLVDAVGTSGFVLGVDVSTPMLAGARRRTTRNGWGNVRTVRADAEHLDAVVETGTGFDAVLFTYSLSIIPGWGSAWDQALGQLREGGRIAVVDTTWPTGWGRLFAPLAALAFFTGGVDPRRAPWRRVESDTDAVYRTTRRSGHIHIAVGTKATSGRASGADLVAGRP